jgi:hypothetical protein
MVRVKSGTVFPVMAAKGPRQARDAKLAERAGVRQNKNLWTPAFVRVTTSVASYKAVLNDLKKIR